MNDVVFFSLKVGIEFRSRKELNPSFRFRILSERLTAPPLAHLFQTSSYGQILQKIVEHHCAKLRGSCRRVPKNRSSEKNETSGKKPRSAPDAEKERWSLQGTYTRATARINAPPPLAVTLCRSSLSSHNECMRSIHTANLPVRIRVAAQVVFRSIVAISLARFPHARSGANSVESETRNCRVSTDRVGRAARQGGRGLFITGVGLHLQQHSCAFLCAKGVVTPKAVSGKKAHVTRTAGASRAVFPPYIR